jgi:hypothetical protein
MRRANHLGSNSSAAAGAEVQGWVLELLCLLAAGSGTSQQALQLSHRRS